MKYHNKKTVIDGIAFDSKAEGLMYSQLKLLEIAGKIKHLRLQPKYTLWKGFVGLDGRKVRDITYSADFSFYDLEQDRWRVLDCKGVKTEVFKIKEKMFNKIMKGRGIKIEYYI